MKWNEETTRQYLDEHGIAYRTYEALGAGSTYEEQVANVHPVLNSPHSPSECLLRYGQIGDVAPKYFNGWSRECCTLVARLGTDVILQSEHAFELVTREGSPIEAQIGGTLEEYLTTLRAQYSMTHNLYPQNPFSED